MQVILHIGPPKTGSTAIQSALFQTREALMEQGVYTFLGSKNVARSLSTLYDRPARPLIPGMRMHFATPQEAKAWSEANWAALEEHVAKEKPPVTLLSSEHFTTMKNLAGFLKRLRGSFDDIRAVYYLREPASLYCSVVDQAIRGGQRLPELPDPWSYVYPGPERLERYIKALGRDKVVVRSFQRTHLHGGDIRSDFFHVLKTDFGLDIDVQYGEQPLNESLCGAASAWMLTLNESFDRMPGQPDRTVLELRRNLVRRLREAPALAGLPKLSIARHPFRDVVRQNARDTLVWYNETLLDEDNRQDIPDPATALPRPEDPGERAAAMAEWIFSHLTPDVVPALLRAATLPEAAGTRAVTTTAV